MTVLMGFKGDIFVIKELSVIILITQFIRDALWEMRLNFQNWTKKSTPLSNFTPYGLIQPKLSQNHKLKSQKMSLEGGIRVKFFEL